MSPFSTLQVGMGYLLECSFVYPLVLMWGWQDLWQIYCRHSEEQQHHWSCMYHTHVLSRRYVGTHTSIVRNEHLKVKHTFRIPHTPALNSKYMHLKTLLYVLYTNERQQITCIASSVTGINTFSHCKWWKSGWWPVPCVYRFRMKWQTLFKPNWKAFYKPIVWYARHSRRYNRSFKCPM